MGYTSPIDINLTLGTGGGVALEVKLNKGARRAALYSIYR